MREISKTLQKRVDKMLGCDEGKQQVVVDELVYIVGRRELILKQARVHWLAAAKSHLYLITSLAAHMLLTLSQPS